MKTRKTPHGYLVRVEHGENIAGALLAFAATEHIKGATITLLGACIDPELGFYDMEKREYTWKRFAGEFEIASGVGNLTLVDGVPFLHLHVVLSDKEFRALGGHWRAGRAGATVEVTIHTTDEPLTREMNDAVGLKLWKL
jgi:uncharacterized protein